MPDMIRASGLVKRYGKVVALDGLDLAGVILAIFIPLSIREYKKAASR